ncbi:MAG: DUF2867 domain-containing protein [Alphaproteobacteria bacterium]|nr:DUF2867 domain-containing protein [Alphaproteobacteria bacterium]
MLHFNRIIKTFPSVSIPSKSGGRDIEVSLIAQMGHGAGDHLFASISSRQRQHADFIDELDEPSTKLGAPDFDRNDPSSFYSFTVGANGHPWHRHAGNRVFTAISGSGGAQLRFSTASTAQIKDDPQNFMQALHFVNIPADCLFTVRFGGETWHQFVPLTPHSPHPTFFALSCHTNELGGNLPDDMKAQVLSNTATIPSLTELLPPDIQATFDNDNLTPEGVPVTTLSLDAPAGTLHRLACDITRGCMGVLRGKWGAWKDASGFISNAGLISPVKELDALPEESLLHKHLADTHLHHEDTLRLSMHGPDFESIGAKHLLGMILQGFLENAPRSVSRLMSLRNALVKPLGLRTSPLGCPVSSLLSDNADHLFCNKYPVFDQSISDDNTKAAVILGADDKHLSFRSCVEVKITSKHKAELTLANRVHCKNTFGKFYIAAIDAVHRKYVSPKMMTMAADYAIARMD